MINWIGNGTGSTIAKTPIIRRNRCKREGLVLESNRCADTSTIHWSVGSKARIECCAKLLHIHLPPRRGTEPPVHGRRASENIVHQINGSTQTKYTVKIGIQQ